MKSLRPIYNIIYSIIIFLAEIVVRLVYPVRTLGRENLVWDKGFVLAPNHLFAIDPVFVLVARGFGKKMLIMAKQELFEKSPLLNFLWYCMGVFPVRRGMGDSTVLQQAEKEVSNGRGLLMFPEGTRSEDGHMGQMKSGAFVVAWQAEVAMIPCYIHYSAGKPKPFHRVTVVFGEPVLPSELGLVGEYGAAKLRIAKRQYTQRLVRLCEDNRERL